MTESPYQPYHPAWTVDAICRQCDPNGWYPQPGTDVSAPVRVCRTCPVKQQCLDYAMAKEVGTLKTRRHGIYGGLFAKQRIALEPQWLAEQVAA